MCKVAMLGAAWTPILISGRKLRVGGRVAGGFEEVRAALRAWLDLEWGVIRRESSEAARRAADLASERISSRKVAWIESVGLKASKGVRL